MCDAPKAASSLAEKLSSRCKETIAAESVLAILVNVWTLVGSVLICLAFYRNVRLRTISNMYVLSFALIDFLMSVLVMPLSLGVIIKGEWTSTASACQFQGYMILVLGCLTMLTMTLTAVDRYFATVRPVQYTYFFKRKYVGAIIALCWFLAFAVSLSNSVSGRAYVFHPGNAVCGMDLTQGDINYRPASLLELFFVIVPLFLIAVCYWRVHVKIISNHEKNMTLFDDDEDVTKLFAIFTMAVFTCWSPYFLINIIDALTTQYSLPRSLYFVCSFFIGVSCCIKPIILYISDVDFKAEFKRILTFRQSRRISDGQLEGAKKKPKVENPKGAPEKRRYLLNEEVNRNRSHEVVEVHNIEKPNPKAADRNGIPEMRGNTLDKVTDGRQSLKNDQYDAVGTKHTAENLQKTLESNRFSLDEVADGRQSLNNDEFQYGPTSTKHTAENPQKTSESKRFFLDEGTDGRESRIAGAVHSGQRIEAENSLEVPEIRGYLFEERADKSQQPDRNADLPNGEKPRRKKKKKRRSDTRLPRNESNFLI